MSIGAAIRITSGGEERTIRHAAAFARQHSVPCFVISIVSHLPYGDVADAQSEAVLRNLRVIAEQEATPLMQEGEDVAETLMALATAFGVTTLFLRSGSSRLLGRSIAEQLLYLHPPFDVVCVGSE